jgi:D-tyrosyl-tRNA(Tyr) deacylase
MRAVVQKVSEARVSVRGEVSGEIGRGILLLLGIGRGDLEKDADYLINKVLNLRIFEDDEDKMNLSLKDIGGSLLVVSQFTLHGDTRKGLRPSFIKAAGPDEAKPLYEYFVLQARQELGSVETGRFREMMDVELVNEGPVTILLDSKKEF